MCMCRGVGAEARSAERGPLPRGRGGGGGLVKYMTHLRASCTGPQKKESLKRSWRKGWRASWMRLPVGFARPDPDLGLLEP